MDFKKIKNIAIYYFSGTGNTLFISEIFKKNFLLKSLKVSLIPIETIDYSKSQSNFDLLVIAFPVHAFKAPKIVANFVNNLTNTSTQKPVLLLATCGGMVSSSFDFLRKILINKGYSVISTFKYNMPDNVSFMFSKDLKEESMVKNLIKNSKEKAENDFNNLYSGKEEIKKTNFFMKLFSNIVFYFLNRTFKKNKWVVDYNKCVFCSICQENCPTKNIVVKKQKREVKFSDKCIMCTRCYNLCPVNAINYKSEKTKNFKRYNVFKKEILNR
jgi:ferredoxin/flavodoxin